MERGEEVDREQVRELEMHRERSRDVEMEKILKS